MGGRGERGRAKMNLPILTSTKVWGIKSSVFKSVDSESVLENFPRKRWDQVNFVGV